MKLLLLACLALAPLLSAAQTLTVSAAASLRESFEAMAPRFTARYPGVQVRFNFAASGVLLQQIRQGAPVDVFASADQETMDRGSAWMLDGTRRDFVANALVLVTPQGLGVQRVSDLALPSVRRVALGKPASVPAGRYAQQALQSLQLWEPLQPKLVLADNVRQVLDYVARGEVEAGFVYRSDALLMPDKIRVAGVVDAHDPIRYPMAVLKTSKHTRQALAFLDYLRSTEAQALLRRHGFTPL